MNSKADSNPWISHTFLQPACAKYINSQVGNTPWFPGPFRVPHEIPDGEILDVVLFGDYLEQIVNFGQWPMRKGYRIWVLCQSVRSVLVELLGFNSLDIAVIPRDVLLPPARTIKPFPRFDSSFTLIYSGRFVSNKNFDLFLRVASSLQTEYGFENMRVKASGFYPFIERELSAAFSFLILKLNWIEPPEILTHLGPQNWMDDNNEDTVLMTLSKHRREDFGVSLAQARQAGWPCVVSNWGGHKDLNGDGILKIPSSLIHRSTTLTDILGVREICDYISEHWQKHQIDEPSVGNRPSVLTMSMFESLFTETWKTIQENGVDALRPEILDSYDRIFGS